MLQWFERCRPDHPGGAKLVVAVALPMRHLEARGFQDFAKIAKEVPGRVVGAADFGRRANTTIQV
jgi:hypothetical protein